MKTKTKPIVVEFTVNTADAVEPNIRITPEGYIETNMAACYECTTAIKFVCAKNKLITTKT